MNNMWRTSACTLLLRPEDDHPASGHYTLSAPFVPGTTASSFSTAAICFAGFEEIAAHSSASFEWMDSCRDEKEHVQAKSGGRWRSGMVSRWCAPVLVLGSHSEQLIRQCDACVFPCVHARAGVE